ncbi:MAG: tRNA adenosine(34) deaminase TadA [Polyangiaceae bacterium]
MASEVDTAFMRLALEEADRAELHGDVPIGCVVVSADGNVLAQEHNRREQTGDPTAHAEVLAVRKASTLIGHWRLEGATVYSTLEPCPMCAGALWVSRIARLVYGARDLKAGAVDTLFEIGRDTRLNHRFEIESGLLAEDCAARLGAFFAKLRAAGEK